MFVAAPLLMWLVAYMVFCIPTTEEGSEERLGQLVVLAFCAGGFVGTLLLAVAL